MKIKKLASILNANKQAAIFETWAGEEVRQYITDHRAIYPVYGLPRLSKENLLTIFDVAPEDHNKWKVTEIEHPAKIWVEDIPESGEDEAVKHFYSPISVLGMELQPVLTKIGVVFFQRKYLDPVKDAEGGITFYVRYKADGDPYIVVKAGLFVQALILEVQPKKANMMEIEAMLRGYAERMGWDMKPILAEEKPEGEQLTIYGRT